MATPQACSDGERIYAYYSCNDVICLDLDGQLIWYRGLGHDFPNASSSLGMSSSPVVSDGALVLQLDTDSESFATGLDALTAAGIPDDVAGVATASDGPAVLEQVQALMGTHRAWERFSTAV